MRRIVTVSALSVVAAGAVLVGCERARGSSEPMTADVERNLQLASSVQGQRTGIVSPIEQISNGAPSGNDRGKRLAVPAHRSAPTPAPSPVVTEVAAATATYENAATDAVDASTTATPKTNGIVAPVAMQTASAAQTPDAGSASSGGPSAGIGAVIGTGNGDTGRNEEGNRGQGRSPEAGMPMPPPGGNVVGGITGVIIRGALAGHDNCEPKMPKAGPAGIIGAMPGIMGASGGDRMPTGSIPGGNTRYPRR